ncbi:GTP 3',8-cyclase MoaA [Candidatus Thioglobus sp.]|jgi:cyclic pyranopterin phosphate synthase|uniref:GTP 3',8-cyclase MoaA n=1 Tax=Candidatus Thioglobus sp. TaxID=2026721 RepID=UPI001D82070C|nr:GTP 3',8-cyclase MoaA [Candidatus Thioglobus sp.]MBT3276375.1 GTP 3',8-cyclase MoaA [Candidatus Thioglobus sp.]MBT3447093.1 GTP 3',8-cyclase MoaA [Candidatus Thioglobus sp.]MBT3745280.1 GTP 3',8-cyclase MoaA [Candidatus Thioglobus sp.]MBT4001179.1 GTP 3',8-cyclase MoaA [Candidatus Thioglobus sp.]MBT4316233.1 GTP 3',8-cyclase MoaA [Candidatus Thioglobus sp.]
MPKLIDKFGRQINYLRISITEHCNFRCFYCRDDAHVPDCKREDILSYEDIQRIVRIFAEMGVTKVRLTGGEPLLRRGIVKIAKLISSTPGITDVPLSTNAQLLEKFAGKLHENGINRTNISIDSLIPERFKEITRGGDVAEVIKGIDAAIAAGMSPIKINAVAMRGVNDDEIESLIDFAIDKGIDIRFIEAMPIGAAGIESQSQYMSEQEILSRINQHLEGRLTPITPKKTDGPASNYKISNTNSTVGVISAVSNHFCQTCNRVRLTAKGDLILCLGQEDSISLKDAVRSDLSDDKIKTMIITAINKKPEKHEFNTAIDNISNRQMVEIGG